MIQNVRILLLLKVIEINCITDNYQISNFFLKEEDTASFVDGELEMEDPSERFIIEILL